MHLKKRVSATKKINQSLASSCAVELFKLVFLSNSKVAEFPNLLEKTLRCYSEHDLFSAFDYLRQKKILVHNFCSCSLLHASFCGYLSHSVEGL